MLKLISNDCKAHRCPAIPAYRRHRQRSVGLGILKIFLTRSQRVDPLRFVLQIRRCNPAMCRAWQGVRRDSDGLTRVQADDEILKYVDDNSHSFLKEGPPHEREHEYRPSGNTIDAVVRDRGFNYGTGAALLWLALQIRVGHLSL